jgi:hypothetical protein
MVWRELDCGAVADGMSALPVQLPRSWQENKRLALLYYVPEANMFMPDGIYNTPRA